MKILFIGHDASRTGAPILLLNLMKWLKENTDFSFDILLMDRGPLEDDYKVIAKVYYSQPHSIKRLKYPRRLINKILKIRYDPAQKYKINLFNQLKVNNYDLVYGNTIVSSTAINEIKNFLPNIQAIIHVHELYDITSVFKKEINELVARNVHFITVSKLTKYNLVEQHNVPHSFISLIYEYIDVKSILSIEKKVHTDKFIINGSGLVQIRKGYDIFICIAKRAKTKYPTIPFYFKWIGYIPNQLEYYLKNDILQSDLNNYVEFTGVLENPYSEFSESSLFLMTSRQDPFPLVCLEHALLEKPIVCFDKGTGISEFVEDDAGIVVPYFDIEAAVDALELLYSNTELRNKLGKVAANKALVYDINIQATKIVELIKEVLSNPHLTPPSHSPTTIKRPIWSKRLSGWLAEPHTV